MKRLTFYSILLPLVMMSSCEPMTYDFATICGTVLDDRTMEPIEGVEVSLSPYHGNSQDTRYDGWFEFTDLVAMQYTIYVKKYGYVSNKKTINAIVGKKNETIITMSKLQ